MMPKKFVWRETMSLAAFYRVLGYIKRRNSGLTPEKITANAIMEISARSVEGRN